MSGPVSVDDTPPAASHDAPAEDVVAVLDGRETTVGGFGVRRMLPRQQRRSVGAWCFVDHMGPGPVSTQVGLDIGPHPHIGLQTVTWLLEGAVLHRDSLGSEQLIRPGQLNLMTAGHGVAHSEQTSGVYRGQLHGVQLWIAQPDATRDGPPAFEHHPELPITELAGGAATVLIGALGDVVSPARRDSNHVGADLDIAVPRCVVPVEPSFEHAVVPLDGPVTVAGQHLEPGRLAYLGVGHHQLVIGSDARARVLLVGGTPFPEPLLMWWNYVARTREEITIAHRDWSEAHGRFGPVDTPLARIDVAGPPWADRTP